VKAEVARIVRPRPGFSLPALSVSAEVRRTRTEYRVRLELTRADETTRREFQSESCNALVRAATLSIALAFGDGADINETNAPEEPAKPEPTPASLAPSATARSPAAHSEPPPGEGIAAKRRLALGLGGSWSPNGLGGNTFGVQALASLLWPRATLTWQSRLWFPHTLHPSATASARFWAATTSLAPALRYRFGAFELELGVALQVGVIRGASADIHSPAEAWAPWYALAPGVGVGVELGRGVRAVLGQEFVLTPTRPEFEITPIGTVFQVPALTPVTTLSVPLDVARF